MHDWPISSKTQFYHVASLRMRMRITPLLCQNKVCSCVTANDDDNEVGVDDDICDDGGGGATSDATAADDGDLCVQRQGL